MCGAQERGHAGGGQAVQVLLPSQSLGTPAASGHSHGAASEIPYIQYSHSSYNVYTVKSFNFMGMKFCCLLTYDMFEDIRIRGF